MVAFASFTAMIYRGRGSGFALMMIPSSESSRLYFNQNNVDRERMKVKARKLVSAALINVLRLLSLRLWSIVVQNMRAQHQRAAHLTLTSAFGASFSFPGNFSSAGFILVMTLRTART